LLVLMETFNLHIHYWPQNKEDRAFTFHIIVAPLLFNSK
jgi:hypothetical protein